MRARGRQTASGLRGMVTGESCGTEPGRAGRPRSVRGSFVDLTESRRSRGLRARGETWCGHEAARLRLDSGPWSQVKVVVRSRGGRDARVPLRQLRGPAGVPTQSGFANRVTEPDAGTRPPDCVWTPGHGHR